MSSLTSILNFKSMKYATKFISLLTDLSVGDFNVIMVEFCSAQYARGNGWKIHLILCSSLLENHPKTILLGVLHSQHIGLHGFKFTSNLLSKKFSTSLGYLMFVHFRNIMQLVEMFCRFFVKVMKLATSYISATKSCKF